MKTPEKISKQIIENEGQIIIRHATENDLEGIKTLLESVSLPSADIDEHINNFLVLENTGNLVATIGIEKYGETALLRSLAVKKEFQYDGYGRKLYQRFILLAEEIGVKYIYLLTTTAETYFSRKGFRRISRNEVPEEIKNTTEYSTLCPSDSVCMVKKLI